MRPILRASSVSLALLACLGLTITGCGKGVRSTTGPRDVDLSRAGATPNAPDTRIPDPAAPYDNGNFSQPTTIDNDYLPLVPGHQYVLEGVANRGGGLLPHRVVLTVTDVTKVIDGVRTVVIWDQDLSEGVLDESELAFFAQDDDGNVWSMGEYPEEYAAGVLTGAPSTWIPGINDALAGTMMLAEPRLGTSYYLQGYSPDIEFFDLGRVFRLDQSTCVPAGCFDEVIVIDEKSPLDAGGHQRKFYAPGVGNVRIGAVGDPEGETLVLVEHRMLTAPELLAAREQVFLMEQRAYQISDVYKQTVRRVSWCRAVVGPPGSGSSGVGAGWVTTAALTMPRENP